MRSMMIKNKQVCWSGIMFTAVGAAFALGARGYAMGTSARMGPGYFPFWLGIALTVLGIIVSLRALSLKAEILQLDGFDWKIVIIVVGSVALCGVVFDRSEEHTSELPSLMRLSYSVFCSKKKTPSQIRIPTAISVVKTR